MRRTIRRLLCLAILAGAAAPAWATDYWMAPTGNDGNSCTAIDSVEATTPTDPGVYRFTLIGVQGCMGAGDRAIIKPGTYQIVNNNYLENPIAGGAGNLTVFMGQPGQSKPIFTMPTLPDGAADETCSFYSFFFVNGSAEHHIRVEGLEIQGTYRGFEYNATGGDPTNIEIINNYLHHTCSAGVITGHGTGLQNHLYRSNEFAYIGIGSPTYGPGVNTMYSVGNGTIVENNYFHNLMAGIANCGGSCQGPYTQSQGIIIRNNVFWRIGRVDLDPWQSTPISHGAIGFVSSGTAANPHRIYNNVIYDSGTSGKVFVGIGCQYDCTNIAAHLTIDNNTIYNVLTASAQAISTQDCGSAPLLTVRNNIMYQAGVGVCGTPGTVQANITSNPFFVNAAGGDFHLTASSTAAINQGVNLTAFGITTDKDGVARPASGSWEIGAYEFGGSPPPVDTTPPAAPSGIFVSKLDAHGAP